MKYQTVKSARLDKWLWAARFFKTRALAKEAIIGGKVHVNDSRAKPSKILKGCEVLEITKGDVQQIIHVDVLCEKRGPSSFAVTLYTETSESILAREQQSIERKLTKAPESGLRKPDKKGRRELRQLKGK